MNPSFDPSKFTHPLTNIQQNICSSFPLNISSLFPRILLHVLHVFCPIPRPRPDTLPPCIPVLPHRHRAHPPHRPPLGGGARTLTSTAPHTPAFFPQSLPPSRPLALFLLIQTSLLHPAPHARSGPSPPSHPIPIPRHTPPPRIHPEPAHPTLGPGLPAFAPAPTAPSGCRGTASTRPGTHRGEAGRNGPARAGGAGDA